MSFNNLIKSQGTLYGIEEKSLDFLRSSSSLMYKTIHIVASLHGNAISSIASVWKEKGLLYQMFSGMYLLISCLTLNEINKI